MRRCGSSASRKRPDVRIAVVGARGQLAAAVAHECAPGHEVIALTHEELDAADEAAVAAAMDRARPDGIVNGAAVTHVGGAADPPLDAPNTNAFSVPPL